MVATKHHPLAIQKRGHPFTTLRPYEPNPRNNDKAVDAVAESILAFGFRQPIVVDTDGVTVVGHTRYKAALKLGLDHVPVNVAKDLTPEQAKAYRLADIAAKQTGRKAHLMEVDPAYCDIIADRFQRFTGRPAFLERTGESPLPMKAREANMR